MGMVIGIDGDSDDGGGEERHRKTIMTRKPQITTSPMSVGRV